MLQAVIDFRLAPLGRRPLICGTLAAWLGLLLGVAAAGGGPESLFLVVNSRRVDSMTIANHYASLRQVPSSNLFYLDWDGPRDIVSVDEFRTKILTPILQEIEERRLERQVDTIVYSTGFPFAVDFASDFGGKVEATTGQLGSLTGLTYLYQQVRARDPAYAFTLANQRSNYYEGNLTRPFSSQVGWRPDGQSINAGGHSYYLSMMLGYSDGRGNTIDEITNYLRRAAMADGSRPDGTIYLMKMAGEVRSTTRDPAFPRVAAALEQEGVKCEILPGVLPSSRGDVLGAVVGRATFDWTKSLSSIVPGAICEHLTSFGGDLRSTAGQTPFTEHLRAGAAGSSGTVAEPFALQAKFPHPWIQVHYARGATLAEAFYLSVASPYQLLIVGDPLCRPWARIPTVAVNELQPHQTVTGVVRMTPLSPGIVPVREYRLFVDGRLIEVGVPGNTFQLDTSKIADGFHELRIVAIEDAPIASQGRLILPVQVDNHGGSIQAVAQADPNRSRIRIQVKSPGAKTVYLFHHRRPVGRVLGQQGEITVDAEVCGRGPVQLAAVGIGDEQRKVYSKPVRFILPETADLRTLPSLPTGR